MSYTSLSLTSLNSNGFGGLAGVTGGIVCCCHELIHTLLFRKQFVPYCTTKYIFWLGKNKFD